MCWESSRRSGWKGNRLLTKPIGIPEEYIMPLPKLLSDDQQGVFFKFYENAKYNDLIPAKYAHMIHTAVAMATGCYP